MHLIRPKVCPSRFRHVIPSADSANLVRLVNMMKVLTSDAVQDPTRVEAKVLREVAMRRHNHDKMNSERKLTDEQRREKVEEKKVNEEKKGLHGAIFKYISPLLYPWTLADDFVRL